MNTVAIILEKTKVDIEYAEKIQTYVYKVCYDLSWSIHQSYEIGFLNILNGIWNKDGYPLIEDTKLQIFRGSISSKYFSETGEEILHCSSTFVENRWSPGVRYCTEPEDAERKYLEKGDVIINRIGRCAGYWNIYTGTRKLVSDCLIIIKEPTNVTLKGLEANSEDGRLKIPLRGVSTPYITIDDVRSLLLNN